MRIVILIFLIIPLLEAYETGYRQNPSRPRRKLRKHKRIEIEWGDNPYISKTTARMLSLDEDLEADDNPRSCRRAKKFYCVSDELCHSRIESAPDCFTNCYDTLTDDIHCSAIGCFFDYNQRRCYGPRPRNSAQRYAVNLCGRAMMDTKGNYFIGGEFPRSNSIQCSCRLDRQMLRNATGDFGLYQCGRKARFSDLNITIPVYEDGIFELELYFAEVSSNTARRALDGYLNGVHELFRDQRIASGDLFNYGYVLQFVFRISNVVKTLEINGEMSMIIGYQIPITIRQTPEVMTLFEHAIMNAVLLRKLSKLN